MEETTLESIPRISWEELQKNFENQISFEALSPLETCLIRIREYKPFVGNVSHAGRRVREELLVKMLIEDHERLAEEDVGADLFVDAFPIQIIALDSRYEYDVNRPRDRAVYLKPFESWGKRVWQHPPTREELELSLAKYDDFHDTVEFVVGWMKKVFGSALVVDLHAFSCRRPSQKDPKKALPTFDLVLVEEDRQVHSSTIEVLKKHLQTIQTPEGPATVMENSVFTKDGAVSMRLKPMFPEVLTLPIEIKKFYMDEQTGELNSSAVSVLQQSLGEIFPKVFAHFQQQTRA